ncbi:MAG TPA: acyl-CoA dehydrogenase family protein [Bacteroidales bacterium]|nr:acyl-CoA dehydrogenase family protein [Bacteroidales bacterium]
MDPFLTKKHEELREKARGFAESEIKPVAAELDEKSEFSPEITEKMFDEGYLRIMTPQEYGGLGMDTLSYIIAVEEIARIDGSQAATVAAQNSLGQAPILAYGTEAQKKKFLPMLTRDKKLWAFGLTEPNAGSDSNNTESTAKLQNGKWVINGKKIYITNAASLMSGGITVQAVTGEKRPGLKELSVIMVPRDTPGYTTELIDTKMMWRAADTGRVYFDNVEVPEDYILGKRGNGSKIMLATLDGGRLSIAAMGLGLAQGAYEMAMEYASNRVQFGKSIRSFQVNSFKLADMALKIELARNLLYKACWLKDNKQPFGKEAAMSKLYTSEIAREIANESLQIHGAHGLMKENPIERFYRDQRILEIGEGTSEILRLVISRHLGIR